MKRIWRRIRDACSRSPVPPPRRRENSPLSLADARPLTTGNVLGRAARQGVEKALRDAGVRPCPYPFAVGMAIVSDLDKAHRQDYAGYSGLLVRELGLDFGDSFRLHLRSRGSLSPEVHAFFRCDGAGPPACDTDRDRGVSHGFHELLREYHLGNLDHFHGLSMLAARCVWLSDVRRETDARWLAVVPEEVESQRDGPFNYRGDFMPVLTLALRTPERPPAPGTAVRLRLRSGEVLACRPVKVPESGGWSPRLSAEDESLTLYHVVPCDEEGPPLLPECREVEVRQPAGTEPADVAAVYLFNTDRCHVRAMLTRLRRDFGVRANLLTDHGSKMFVNLASERRHGRDNAKRAHQAPLPALCSRVARRDVYYSCLGDDPTSVAYVLPDLRDRFGLRFINPGGTSGEPAEALDLLDTVVPAYARDGSVIYVARRICPPLPPDAPSGLEGDQGTRSFPLRLGRLLDLPPARGLVARPVYTHLGNLKAKQEKDGPYFPPEVLHRLQDRVFGFTGAAGSGGRVWLTRASILYDYCLLLRSLGDHVHRSGPDCIHLRSWHDPVLDRRLPESANQLHGATFYVDDPWRARVWLDGQEIRLLVRNGPDETGRPSVTVLGPGPEHLVLDDWDFIGSAGAAAHGLAYRWEEDPDGAYRGRGYARLTLEADGGGEVRYRPRHLDPAGTQYLVWAVRPRAEGVRSGMVLETVTGGRFYFGDPEAAPAETLTARYRCAPAGAGGWTVRVVPFYDVDWSEGTTGGGPLPSHPVEAFRFRLTGPAGGGVDLDRVSFIRPGTLRNDTGRDGCVLGGRIAPRYERAEVTLGYEVEGEHVSRCIVVRHPDGMFAFTGVPPGTVVSLEGTADGRPLRPRRGRRFDLWNHDMTVVLQEAEGAGQD